MSQSLWHWIPWNPGRLSNLLHQLKLTCRLINLYPEIGFDVVTLTDNDAEQDPSQCQWILNYILLLLLMNVISVDTSISWFFYQDHSAPADLLHILSFFSHDIIGCGNNSSYY